MKTINFKIFALVAALLTSSFVFAQEANFEWMAGDTIVIKKTTKQYLTGEQPSKWVYYVQHTIQQVHGKRFPKGILVRGIYSWVGENDIILKGAIARPTVEESLAAYKKMHAGLDELKGLGQEVANMNPNDRAALEAYAKATGADVLQKQQIEEAAAVNAKAQEELMEEYLKKAKAEAAAMDEAQAAKLREEMKDLKSSQKSQQAQIAELMSIVKPNHSLLDAQHRFTLGVRGGFASFMKDPEFDLGGAAHLDLQYAYYFGGKKVNPGILVGASLGYATTVHSFDWADARHQYDDIRYEVIAAGKETSGQLQVEIPVMFTMLTEKGFFLNVGPKVLLPVYAITNQKLTNSTITATLYDRVNMTNEVVTGVVPADQVELTQKGADYRMSKFGLSLGLELGYEWLLKSGNGFTLGAYADYALPIAKPLAGELIELDVDPTMVTPTTVNVNLASQSLLNSLGYLDFGVKVAYHFNFRK